MKVKESIIGVRCEFSENQQETGEDETAIMINGKELYIKNKNLGIMHNAEKSAVLGESPCYIKSSGIFDIAGPSRRREYWLKINSRGYLKELFVEEESVILN